MEIEYRHPMEADIEAMTEVLNQSSKDLKQHSDDTAQSVRTWTFGEEDYDPKGYLMAFADSQPVAYGGSTIQKGRLASGFNDAYVTLSVIPEWRGKGIENHMMNSTFTFLRSNGIGCAKYWTPESTGWRNNIALELGMKDIRHGYMMVYDRKERPSAQLQSEGFAFSHKMFDECKDADISDFVMAFNDSFTDHWNFSPMPTERFIKVRDEDAKSGESILRLTLAQKGNDIAGVCFYGINTKFNEQNNKKVGWINILGVRKPHRRLGLGKGLLTEAMFWLWDQGMNTMYLGMDAENSKALNLYLSLGYRVDQEGITYELVL